MDMTIGSAAGARPRDAARSQASVCWWLYALAALVVAMVLLGGATRLTDSGLSITEWKPVVGVIPPLSEAAWEAEFDKYRQIPQYRLVNKGMSLDAFKTIFWWEWAHRFLGRLIGLAFLVPFLAFLAAGRIDRRLMPRLLVLFALGGLQGVVGWWMVASGLVERVDVSQYRLAVHLTLACVILAAILWTARSLAPARPAAATRTLRIGAFAVLAAVFAQIFLGGLVAGLDAGLAYNTWPLMDGRFIPSGLFHLEPAWLNLFENPKTVQFAHRMMAWLVAAIVLVHAAQLLGGPPIERRRAAALIAALALQFALGVATLLHVVPLSLGLAHQAGALLLLVVAVWNAQALTRGAPRRAALAQA